MGDIAAILRKHPLVVAMQKQVDEAEVELQIAKAKYKPAWGVEVSYGLRDGENPDGTGWCVSANAVGIFAAA